MSIDGDYNCGKSGPKYLRGIFSFGPHNLGTAGNDGRLSDEVSCISIFILRHFSQWLSEVLQDLFKHHSGLSNV